MIDPAWLSAWWAENGLLFLAGGLGVTGIAALLVAQCAAPIHRQRIAEVSVGVVLAWTACALLAGSRPDLAPPEPAGTAPLLPDPITLGAGAVAQTGTEFEFLAILDLLGVSLAAGASFAFVYLLAGRLLLWRLLHRARPAPRALLAYVMGLQVPGSTALRRLRIVFSDATGRPFCCGLLRPIIVLPSALRRRPFAELQGVLLHEAGHIAQRDPYGHALFAVALPLCYWNPLFWWLRRQARRNAEFVADDLAVRHFDKVTYVRELIELAARTPACQRAVVGLIGEESEFFERMKMLIERKTGLSHRCSPAHTLAGLFCALMLVGCGATAWTTPAEVSDEAASQSPAPKEKTPPGPRPDSPLCSFNFVDADPQLIIGTIAKIAGANIVIAPTLRGTVSLKVEAVPWRDVLDATVEPLGHHVVDLGGILHVCKKDG